MSRTRPRFGGLVYLVFVGAGLIGFGVWMALVEMGAPVPDLTQGWPAFQVWGGLAFWLGFLLKRRAFGLVFPGTLAILSGIFFFPFSFGSVVEIIGWPVAILAAGATLTLLAGLLAMVKTLRLVAR